MNNSAELKKEKLKKLFRNVAKYLQAISQLIKGSNFAGILQSGSQHRKATCLDYRPWRFFSVLYTHGGQEIVIYGRN